MGYTTIAMAPPPTKKDLLAAFWIWAVSNKLLL
jgi:hypothetical protein